MHISMQVPLYAGWLRWMEYQHRLWVPSFQEDGTVQTLSVYD